MYETFERMWVSFMDSPRFRHFSGRGAGAKLFESQAYRRAYLAKNYLTSGYSALSNGTAVRDVRTFCLFVGHNKSGTSLLGSLLDAHPNVILADEVGALAYVAAGFRREQIFHLLLRGSRRERLKGRVTARRLKAYSFLVPGQWQGTYRKLEVIGDGTAGSSTQRFAKDPTLLPRLRERMGPVEVKFIQMIRNPYDPISVMMVRGKRSFENALAHYFANAETMVGLRKTLDDGQLLAVRYEDFVAEPTSYLAQVCSFLGLEAADDYLQACAGILYPAADHWRHLVKWDRRMIQAVADKMAQYEFLGGYAFDH